MKIPDALIPDALIPILIALNYPGKQGTNIYIPKIDAPLLDIVFGESQMDQYLRTRDARFREAAAIIREREPRISTTGVINLLQIDLPESLALSDRAMRDILKEEP